MGGGPSQPIVEDRGLSQIGRQNTPETQATSQPSRSAAGDIPILSVFHPFPLRLDTQGNGTKIQYDACFQVGEFPSEDPSSKVRGTTIVILVPLKADPMPGDGAIFINAVSRHIPTILAAQQDPVNGYPDTPAATGADWNISQVVKTDRSYYTWVNRDGTRVIVMAEPILVSEGDIANILRLPVTPPEDVIHEIGDVRYKPAPPIDSKGNPVPCKSRVSVPQVVPGPSAVAMAKMNKPAVSGTDWLAVILGILGSIAVLLGVWFGLKAAMGPGGDFLKTIGDMLGKSLAGGYGALKKARSGTAGVLGIGPGGPLPAQRNALRSPTQVAQAPATTGTPAQVADAPASNIPEPSGDFSVTNPGYSSKQAFIDRHKTQRAPRPGLKIRTPVQVANTPAPAGTPAATADIPGPSAEELLRRNRAESFRRKSPAGTGLFDLRTPAGTIDDIAQRKPKGPGRVAITEPEESNAQKIARLARAKKASSPAPAPRRRKIMMEEPDEEETPEERIARRAKETALPRPSYNGPVLQELKRRGDRIDEKGYGGRRKRRNRLKTGRKV